MERKFLPVSIALLTVSDTRVLENDKSGDLLADKIEGSGHILFDRKIVKDVILDIQEISKEWIKCSDVEVIISTGGTGLTGRDVSPEAFRSIFDKEIEGSKKLERQQYNQELLQVLRTVHIFLFYPEAHPHVKMHGMKSYFIS